jgi:Trypsin
MFRSLALARETGRRLAPIVFAIIAGVTLAGRTTDEAAAMVGGAPPAASGIGRSVVLILGSYGSSSTACTATAIGRDLLLTAAHCVQPGADYKLVASETGDAPVLKDVARIEREPQFDLKRLFDHLATADVALIKLAEPVPARIPPVRIGSEAETVTVGDTLVVVGYGDTVRGDGRTGGTVRAAPLVVTGQPGTLQIRLVDPATKGASAGLGACTGGFRGAGISRGRRQPHRHRRGELVDRSEFERRLRGAYRNNAACALSCLDRRHRKTPRLAAGTVARRAYCAGFSATRMGPCNGRSSTAIRQARQIARQMAAAMKTQ